MIGPDATVTLDFALHRMAGVIEKLLIYPDHMQANLDKLGGLVYSQYVLLALTQAGMSREDAYSKVQEHAMKTWREGGAFLERLQGDAAVTGLVSAETLQAVRGAESPAQGLALFLASPDFQRR